MNSHHHFDLYYQEQGDPKGLPVIFIHAFPMTHAMWEPQLKVLPKKCYGITYDIRGLGKSPLGEGSFMMETYVDDLRALMDHLHLPKAILCGLSLGGYIALRAVEKYPERVRGLILCDTRSEADNNEGKLKRAQSLQLLKTQGVKAFAQGFIPSLIGPTTGKERPAVVKKIEDIILSQSVQGICAAQLALVSRTDTTESLAKIKLPSLILVGEEDALTPVALSEAMQKRIPDSQLQVISQAGHMSNVENPEEFNRHWAGFLEEIV